MTIASNIVVEWLRSLHLGQYSESFIDNGYDDLEICKQIGDPDLDAIGVFNQTHRGRLLQSVKTLREEGAASVYFTLEETTDCLCDNVSSKSSRTSSERPTSEKEAQRASPTASSSSGGQELTKFADEYEEGKAELVRIPRIQLRMLLQEKLRHDGIRLSCQPYTTPEGEQGYLEGLASRYADLFRTHYSDVLEPLEELRRRETNASPRMPNTQLTTSHSQPIYVPGKYSPSSCLSDKEEDEIYGFGYGVFGRQMLQQRQQKLALATQNTPLTAPGGVQQQQTYQSCLSPRSAYFYEFPPNEQGQNTSKKKTTFSRLLRGLKTHRKEKQQGQSQGSPRHGRARFGVPQRVDTPDSVLQSGLGMGPDMGHTILRSMVDPRDYDRLRYLQMNGGQPNSFEETIHRLKVQDALRKKERFHKEHEEILRDIRQGLMQLGRDGRGQLPGDDTYMYDEDARCGGVAGGAMLTGGPGPQHWYDEPPYESDPEDFLMGASGAPVPTATIQNGRVCFTLNLRPENRGEGVISLRTAGDISLPRDRSRKVAMSTMRGLIVPQGHNNPPTIIPLTHSRASRESGDYASSDVQSSSSRQSTVSVDDEVTTVDKVDNEPRSSSQRKVIYSHESQQINHRSDDSKGSLPCGDQRTKMTRVRAIGTNVGAGNLNAHNNDSHIDNTTNSDNKTRSTNNDNGITVSSSKIPSITRRAVPGPEYSRSSGEEGLSPSQSSDYEDQEELENQHTPAIHTSEASALLESGSDGRVGIAGRARNLRHDVQRKITRLREDRASSEAFPCSASSVESLPSGSGSSTQALVRAGSNHSSISCEEREPASPTSIGPVLCRAKALVDYTPSPYDKEALKFKKGDIIDVVQMNTSGLWKGVVHNRIGHFKFINVEILNERVPRRGEPERTKWGQRYRQKPGSVQELLQRMNLQEHIPVFVLNGYEDLELFRELEPADLDYLRIHQPEHRAKILTAVQLLHELQSGSEGDLASSSEGDEINRLALTSGQTSGHCSPFSRRQFPRDSGCYDAHKNPTRSRNISPEIGGKMARENNLDTAIPPKCTTSLETNVTESKDDFHRNIPISGAGVIGGSRDSHTFEKTGQHLRSGAATSNVRFIAKRGNLVEAVVIGEEASGIHKISGINTKYGIGGCSDLGIVCEGSGVTTAVGLGQRGCLSEKSSDSGVSSSSLSSAPPPRDKGLVSATSSHPTNISATGLTPATSASSTIADSPTKSFANFSRGPPTSQPTTSAKSTNDTTTYP